MKQANCCQETLQRELCRNYVENQKTANGEMNMEQVSSHNKFIKGFTQLLKDTKPIIVSSTI